MTKAYITIGLYVVSFILLIIMWRRLSHRARP